MEQPGKQRPGEVYAVADAESKYRGTLNPLFKNFASGRLCALLLSFPPPKTTPPLSTPQPAKPTFLYTFFFLASCTELCLLCCSLFFPWIDHPTPGKPGSELPQVPPAAAPHLVSWPRCLPGCEGDPAALWMLPCLLPIYAPSYTPTPPISFELGYYFQRAKLSSLFSPPKHSGLNL